MSILLKQSNWLVADWVMRRLKVDLIALDKKNKYLDIYNDLINGEKLFTYLLDYSKVSKDKLTNLYQLSKDIIRGYEKNELVFDGESVSGDAYIIKIEELLLIINKESVL